MADKSAENSVEEQDDIEIAPEAKPYPLQIVAYCCEHCAYAAADLAGGLRMRYPPQIKIVQLPCTGKVDVLMILNALEEGVDGVMVAG